jgi:hypothetical protein
MCLDDAAYDREPEASAVVGAVVVAGAAGVGAAPSQIEHACQVCFRDAAAAVVDRQQRAVGFRCGHDAHAAVRRGMPDGIDYQVDQCAG